MSCVTDTLQSIKKKSGAEFNVYTSCLRENNGDFSKCREQQSAFRAAYAQINED